jgi:RNA polymerase sigma factor (sigma-70 family)
MALRIESDAGEVGALDVAELYATHASRLRKLVRLSVRASEPVIEDACQFAWSRLFHHRSRVQPEAALSWLLKTAVHEAFKLVRRDSRELSLEGLLERAGDSQPLPATVALDELVEQRARLESISCLPERQQRLVWLQGLGLSYAEMAGETGATTRTVERQLLRARRALVRAAECEWAPSGAAVDV